MTFVQISTPWCSKLAFFEKTELCANFLNIRARTPELGLKEPEKYALTLSFYDVFRNFDF